MIAELCQQKFLIYLDERNNELILVIMYSEKL
jgi:hypothetical protein